jgi:hypothetical protein
MEEAEVHIVGYGSLLSGFFLKAHISIRCVELFAQMFMIDRSRKFSSFNDTNTAQLQKGQSFELSTFFWTRCSDFL